MALNVITAKFCSGATQTWASDAWQYDYGQVLLLDGIDLPDAYEVHFSNTPIKGNAKPQIGNADGVAIPDEYFESGEPIYAWFFLHQGEDDGETEKMVTIPIKKRSKVIDEQPTPVEQSAITQAIAALNIAVEKAEDAIEHYPQIIDGTWHVWDVTTEAYVDTGVQAQGPQGVKGDKGDNGTSPTITVTDITDGNRVTITDADGTKTFDVMNGAQGDPGAKGDPGADGVSPTVTVTEITGGHRVVITDASGEHTFDVMDGQGGGTITVDSAMSSTSENPVQNKVINAALGDLMEDLSELQDSKADIIISSAEGNVASFSDGAEYDAVSMIAHFEPYQEGTGDPSPDNVRPITGHTEVNVMRMGKNLLNDTIRYLSSNQATLVFGQTSSAITEQKTFLKAGTYTFSVKCDSTQRTSGYYKKSGDATGQRIWTMIYGDTSGVFTLDEDSWCSFWVYDANTINPESIHAQVELGSTATDYEPHQSKTYPITFPTEAGTVYGGYVDVTRGKLIAEWKKIAIETITYVITYSSGVKYWTYERSIGSINLSLSNKNLFYCNKFVSTTGVVQGHFYVTGGGNTAVFVPWDSEQSITTVAEANAWIANNPIEIVVPLAVPIEYDITPTVIALLKGYNNVWNSAGGNNEVQYKADTKLYIDNLLGTTEDDMTANANIASGKFFSVGNRLFLSTAAIAQGATITPGTNCTELTISEALNQVNA